MKNDKFINYNLSKAKVQHTVYNFVAFRKGNQT